MKKLALVFVFSLWLVVVAFPQRANTVASTGEFRSKLLDGSEQRIQTFELDSKLLGRKTWFRVILPPKYVDQFSNGRIYPTLYLLHGLAGHFENWTGLTKISDYATDHDWIIVTPEGGDGWYTDSSTVPNDRYETYILQEVIPEIDHRFRTIAERRGRAIAGLSMGGYGAIKFGLKYPNLFSLVGSFSGALDAPLRGQNSPFLRPSIISVFGPEGSKTRKDNDIYNIVREMPADQLKTIPFIYLDCGTEDSFFQMNRDFDSLLIEKKIPHEFRELPGKHEWPYWDSQVQEFLRLADRRLKTY